MSVALDAHTDVSSHFSQLNCSRLTDFNLNELIILATANLQHDIEKLAIKINSQNRNRGEQISGYVSW